MQEERARNTNHLGVGLGGERSPLHPHLSPALSRLPFPRSTIEEKWKKLEGCEQAIEYLQDYIKVYNEQVIYSSSKKTLFLAPIRQ